jgi:hypothetical protein
MRVYFKQRRSGEGREPGGESQVPVPYLVPPAVRCLTAWLLLIGMGQAAEPDQEAFDPAAIRRVLIPLERVATELEQVRPGTLLQLPREEFEKRVQRAIQVGAPHRDSPRLVEALYRAKLVDTALLGTSQWKVLNPRAGEGILPVLPFNLAVQRIRIQKLPFDATPAILGDLEGKGLGLSPSTALYVPQAGEHAVFLDWTARGEAEGGGLHFDLQVPASVVSTLEVDVPADRVVSVAADTCLVSGPHPADTPDRRSWRIDFGNRSQVDLVIRRDDGPGQPPPIALAHVQTRQDLGPDLLQADFEFKIEMPQGGIRDFILDCDPQLRPYEIEVAALESWDWQPPKTAGAAATLTVQLREPFRGGVLRVRCLAPFPADKTWTCPAIHLKGVIDRGETLIVRIPPELQLKNWHSGDFRFTQNASDRGNWQVVSLTRIGLSGKVPLRPSAVVVSQGPEVRIRQSTWWQLGNSSTALTTQVTYEIERGRLFQLSLLLPRGWQVDQVKLTPSTLLRYWHVVHEKGVEWLQVELEKPLEKVSSPFPAAPAPQLVVRLRPAAAGTSIVVNRPAAIPQVISCVGRLRESNLGISVDALSEVAVNTKAAIAPADDTGPWGRQAPDYFFTSRIQPVEGTVTLRPRRNNVRARCNSELVIASGRAVMLTRLFLQPDVGNPESIDVALSAPVAAAISWKTKRGGNRVRSVRRLPAAECGPWLSLVGTQSPFLAAGVLLAQPDSPQWYRLTLARPLRGPLVLESTFELGNQVTEGTLGPPEVKHNDAIPQKSSERLWKVPLPLVLQADALEGEVALYLGGTEFVQVEARGLRESPGNSGFKPSTAWRTFHYAHFPAGLTLRGQVLTADRSAEAIADSAQLTTFVDRTGRLIHHYAFVLWNWRQATLPLRLPAGSRPLAVKSEGRWIVRLPAEASREGLEVVSLPVSGGIPLHRYEIVYATESPSWNLWGRLQAPARASPNHKVSRLWEPELPVHTVGFRHTWRLPPGVRPLRDDQWDLLPGGRLAPGATFQFRDWLAWARIPSLLPSTEKHPDDRQHLSKLANDLLHSPRSAEQAFRLGDLLASMFFDELQGQELVVVDGLALEQAGWTALTPLVWQSPSAANYSETGSFLTWEQTGLVFFPCQSALILTSQCQADSWSAARAGNRLVAEPVQAAVQEAVAQGHDRSNRFRNLIDWLAGSWGATSTAFSTLPAAMLAAGLASDWVEWEAHAGQHEEGAIVFVREDILGGLGIVAAVTLVLAAWPMRRWPQRIRLALALSWLALAALGWIWLPETLRPLVGWPSLAGIVVACYWYMGTIIASLRVKKAQFKTAQAATIALACAAGLPGQAAAPSPPTVYILAGPAEAPEKQTVLATPDLLEHLQSALQRGSPALGKPVVISSLYEGTVAGARADFQADFQIHCWADTPTRLTLPLGSVQLKEALLDGTAAHLQYVKPIPPQLTEGYTLEMKGRGLHTLQIRFAVTASSKGEDRDLKYSIPELAQSRLVMSFPPGTCFPHVLAFRGAHRLTPLNGAANPNRWRVEADLGRVNSIHVRWREDATPSANAALVVREAFLWSIRMEGSSLSAVWQYAITKGAVSSLSLDIPEELEIRSVGVGRLPGETTDESGPRLINWRQSGAGGQRHLLLSFQRPITRGVQIMLELVPRQPFASSAVLRLPAPLDAGPAEGPGKEHFLAYRVDGLSAQVAGDHLGITRAERQPFVDFWRMARMGDPGLQTHVYTIRRNQGAPFLRLILQPPPSQTHGVQGITWTVTRQRAEFVLSIRLTAPDQDFVLGEWDIPKGVNVDEVSGVGIRSWSQTGSRLQVWWQSAVTAATVQITGWKALERAVPARPRDQKDQTPAGVFVLAPVRSTTIASVTNFVRIVSADDCFAHAEVFRNLLPLPNSSTATDTYDLVAEKGDYGGRFAVQERTASIDAQILTLADVVDRKFTFQALLDYSVGDNEPRLVTLRINNWDSESVRIEAPGAQVRPEQVRDASSQVWSVALPRGTVGHRQIKISGSKPLKPGTEILMPDVTVDPASPLERWVAIAGRELRVDDPRGLQLVSNLAPLQKLWPGEMERVRRAGSLWQIQSKDWQFRMVSASFAESGAAVQVFLTEQADSIADGQHWVHQTTHWLYHDSAMDLTVLLPDKARILAVALDETEVTPLQPEPNRLWLPLSGSAGSHVLRLKWAYDGEVEPLDRPLVDGPRIEGVPETLALRTLHIPSGYALASAPGDEEPSSAAAHDLRRAEAQYQLSAVLAERFSESGAETFKSQLLIAQELLYRYCWLAELRNRTTKGLETWRKELKDRNRKLAEERGFEAVRAQAERQVKDHLQGAGSLTPDPLPLILPQQGTPSYWIAPAGSPSARFVLVGRFEERARERIILSALILLFFLGIWVVSFFPTLVVRIQRFWPEQCFVLAGLAWALLGMNWLSLFVGLMGFAGRLFIAGQGLKNRLDRRKAAAAVESAANASS